MGRGDRSTFAEFALARAGALHRAAYLMVGDNQLAQDLVQVAWTKTDIGRYDDVAIPVGQPLGD